MIIYPIYWGLFHNPIEEPQLLDHAKLNEANILQTHARSGRTGIPNRGQCFCAPWSHGLGSWPEISGKLTGLAFLKWVWQYHCWCTLFLCIKIGFGLHRQCNIWAGSTTLTFRRCFGRNTPMQDDKSALTYAVCAKIPMYWQLSQISCKSPFISFNQQWLVLPRPPKWLSLSAFLAPPTLAARLVMNADGTDFVLIVYHVSIGCIQTLSYTISYTDVGCT